MKDLLFMVAALVPKERHMQDLKNALEDCILFPDDEEKENHLQMHMTMLMISMKTKGSTNEAMRLAKDVDDKDKKLSLFETGEN